MGDVQKILVVGLDQAGKTSILNILQQKFNKMDNIKPTVGIERDEIKIFGFPLVTWDLGGQEKFRREYLIKKNIKIFDNTDSLFFVIDTLNEERYEEALQYFTDILEVLEGLDTRPKLVLLIHKVDPNIREEPETLAGIDKIKKLFTQAGVVLQIYTTSIYDRVTIIEAFSRTFQELISNLEPLKGLLKSICILLKLDAAILFDENLMILNEFYQNKAVEEVCLNTVYNSIYYITNQNPKLAADLLGNFKLVLNIKHRTKRFEFMAVEIKGWNMYLLAMSDILIVGEGKLDEAKVLEKFNTMAHLFEKKV